MSTIAVAVRNPPRSPATRASLLRRMSWALPTWGLITTKNLELRRRRGLMIAVFLLVLGPPVVYTESDSSTTSSTRLTPDRREYRGRFRTS